MKPTDDPSDVIAADSHLAQDTARQLRDIVFIMMVDAFDADNGATRFVPGSHLQPREPGELVKNLTANRSARHRRSLQGHFVPREARASVDHASRTRPEVLQRIGDRAK